MTMPRPKQLVVRLTERENEDFRRAAELAGLPLSDWVRRRRGEAAEEVIRESSRQRRDGS